jgi:dihydroxyacetone kinase-like predicted kinase
VGTRGSGADGLRDPAGDDASPRDAAGDASPAGPVAPLSTDRPGDVVGLEVVLRWADGAVAVLERARPVLDRANVFPVPDADTGTNLAATLRAARDAAVASAESDAPSADRVLQAFARGALVGARGSSGVILSEFLRGLAGAAPSGTGAAGTVTDATRLARALDRGARRAVAAVVDPRPGTMLTAARGAADAALEAAAGGGDLVQTVESARSGASQALRRSVDELDVLRAAGVLDAGAYGFVLLLDALAAALGPDLESAADRVSVGHGTIVLMDSLAVADAPAGSGTSAGTGSGTGARAPRGDDLHGSRTSPDDQERDGRPGEREGHGNRENTSNHTNHGEHHAVDGEFELMCVVRHAVRRSPTPASGDPAGAAAALERPSGSVSSVDGIDSLGVSDGVGGLGGSDALAAVAPALRSGLQQVGDSVVVVGGADHEVADASGDLHGLWQVHVHTDHPLEALRVLDRWDVGPVVVRCLSHQVSAVSTRAAGTSAPVGVVACTASPGLVMDLARSGAVVVLRGDGAIERSDLLRAVHETDAEHVVVLPADEQTLAVAGGLSDLSHPQTTVVGSTSDLHVVAALSAWVVGTTAPSDDLAGALAPVVDAVGAVRAVRLDASRPAGVRDGIDSLLSASAAPGPVAGRTAPGPDLATGAMDRATDVASSPALTVLTVLVGDLVPGQVVDDLVSRAEHLVPGVEVVVLPSGRRSTALVIGAEQQ